jgi:pre-mRNA-splicing factor ATP-dependent RNA helicase DHX38/PRP16
LCFLPFFYYYIWPTCLISFYFSLKIEADTAAVEEHGDVDFKADAKFSQHLKVDAVSDFAKSKTIQEQRQYLPIYSVRDELLQV